MQMAKDILKDIMPVEIDKIMDNALMSNQAKMEKIKQFSSYTILAIGRNIDEINKKL